MTYLIYARKYRPKTFEEMIGQKPVVQTLQNAIKNNRVAQAYIFSGMRGVGKTTAARIFAKALNCQHGPTAVPCNKCEFCRAITEDRSVDVQEIDGASNRGIDEVRSLREGVKYRPIQSRHKIIIIDEVHMLTREAFNALLKTLEEPPPHTIFIFATTEFHKVPATIVSRCQHFEFKKISQKEIINHLVDITQKEEITISPFGLNLIAQAADGSLRDAQSLLDQAVAFSGDNISDEDLKEILGIIDREILFEFSTAVIKERPEKVFSLVETVIDNGYDLRFFYRELIQHFRSLLLIQSVKNAKELLLLSEEDMKRLQEEAKKASPEEMLRYLVALQQGEQGLKFSSHPRIYLEVLLVKLAHYKKVTPLKDILRELEEMKRGAPPSVETHNSSPMPSFQTPAAERKQQTAPQAEVQKKKPGAAKKDQKEIFDQILERLQREESFLGALLSQHSSFRFKQKPQPPSGGKESAGEPTTLEIFFPGGKKFFMDTLLKKKKSLEKVVSEVMDTKVEVNIAEEMVEEEGKREKEMEKALKDPTVQSFMDTFKARILSVEPLKRAKDKE
ncbi:MAG: DNA polymerase III subunit gamma/tau [Candidatus Aminicenantes bacterium]